MNLSQLDKILANESKFRAKQVRQLIWRDLIEDWDEATTLPVKLRAKLKLECPLEIKAEVFEEKDKKSIKALITLEDSLIVETVLMRHTLRVPQGGSQAGRNTVCVSSQIGCPLGCTFCATGRMGFKRNLTASEIVEQVLWWARWLKKDDVSPFVKGGLRGILKSSPALLSQRRESERVNNVVFMGMGEPFLNYDNVFDAIKILNDDNLLGIGARHISISTVGIIEGIQRMAEDMPQINLAISLHAPNDALRKKLMPINKKYPLAAVMATAKDYVAKTNRKLMFEYIMIKGVNDSEKQAKELVDLLGDRLFFVNLIVYNRQGVSDENLFSSRASEPIIPNRYNPTGDFNPSESAQIKKFKDILMKAGVQALERYRFGQDIKGACGQLAAQITPN